MKNHGLLEGAVMGSKNLKAIAVYGSEKVPIARPDEMKERSKAASGKIKENPVTSQGLPTYGTAVLINIINEHGAYPSRNFQTGYFPEADKQSGETLARTYLTGNIPIGIIENQMFRLIIYGQIRSIRRNKSINI